MRRCRNRRELQRGVDEREPGFRVVALAQRRGSLVHHELERRHGLVALVEDERPHRRLELLRLHTGLLSRGARRLPRLPAGKRPSRLSGVAAGTRATWSGGASAIAATPAGSWRRSSTGSP